MSDEVRTFPLGRFELVHMDGASFGPTYGPGWKWSEHNAPVVGTALCHAPALTVSGIAEALGVLCVVNGPYCAATIRA